MNDNLAEGALRLQDLDQESTWGGVGTDDHHRTRHVESGSSWRPTAVRRL